MTNDEWRMTGPGGDLKIKREKWKSWRVDEEKWRMGEAESEKWKTKELTSWRVDEEKWRMGETESEKWKIKVTAASDEECHCLGGTVLKTY